MRRGRPVDDVDGQVVVDRRRVVGVLPPTDDELFVNKNRSPGVCRGRPVDDVDGQVVVDPRRVGGALPPTDDGTAERREGDE